MVERHLTEQHFTIILLKKQLNVQYWPHLQKTEKLSSYIRTDFNRWAWEDDQNDDIISAKLDGDALRMNTTLHFREVIFCPINLYVMVTYRK